MGLSVEDLIGRVKVPVRSVTIVLDSSSLAEYDELREKLDAANRQQVRMTQTPEAVEIAARMQELEAEMREASEVFQFKGISKNALNNLVKRFPPKKGQGTTWDVEAGSVPFVAAASQEPAMTEDEAGRLCDALAQGQWDKLVSTAWLATNGDGSVPFSARASEVMHANGSK